MRVAIIGAAGMIGRKLVERIATTGHIGGQIVDAMTLVDVIIPHVAEDFVGEQDVFAADLSAPDVASRVIAERPEVIVHLAAIVSGEAEASEGDCRRRRLLPPRDLCLFVGRVRRTVSGKNPR